jgi:hypothetical protein
MKKKVEINKKDKSVIASSRIKKVSDKVVNSEGCKKLETPKYTKAELEEQKIKETILKVKAEEDAKAAAVARAISDKDTALFLDEIANESEKGTRAFMADIMNATLKNELGNTKLNEELKSLENTEKELVQEYQDEINNITETKKFRKARKKILKKAKKNSKKLYKKAKKKYGKKTARLLLWMSNSDFSTIYTFKPLKSKWDRNLMLLREECEKKKQEIIEDKKNNVEQIESIVCPKVAAYDVNRHNPQIINVETYLNEYRDEIYKGPRENGYYSSIEDLARAEGLEGEELKEFYSKLKNELTEEECNKLMFEDIKKPKTVKILKK